MNGCGISPPPKNPFFGFFGGGREGVALDCAEEAVLPQSPPGMQKNLKIKINFHAGMNGRGVSPPPFSVCENGGGREGVCSWPCRLN